MKIGLRLRSLFRRGAVLQVSLTAAKPALTRALAGGARKFAPEEKQPTL